MIELDVEGMRLLCERDDSKIYLDGDKYVITKEKRGEISSTTEYLVKDWEICPWECHKSFGYRIVDMEFVGALYDKLVLGKKDVTVKEIIESNKRISAERRAGGRGAKRKG